MKQGQVRVALEQRGPGKPRIGPCSPMTLPARLPLSRETRGTRGVCEYRAGAAPGPPERLCPPAPDSGRCGGLETAQLQPGWKIRRAAPGQRPRSAGGTARGRPQHSAGRIPAPAAEQGRAEVETPGARRGGQAALGGQGGTAGRHRGAAPSPPRPGPAPAELGEGRRGEGGSRAGPSRARPGGAGRAAGRAHLELHLRVHLEQRGHGGSGLGAAPLPRAHTGNDLTPRARQCRARPPPA